MKHSLIRHVVFLLALLTSPWAFAQCGQCKCLREERETNRVVHVVVADRRVENREVCLQGCNDLFGGRLGGANTYSFTELEQKKCQDCGRHWTGWKEVGARVGSPCPKGCERDKEVGSNHRVVGFPSRPQHKHKFQCLGVPDPPG